MQRELRSDFVAPGASFWKAPHGEIMFKFVNDASSIVGPRKAQRMDSVQHPEAWSTFVATLEVVHDVTEPEPAAVAQPEPVADVSPPPKRAYVRRAARPATRTKR